MIANRIALLQPRIRQLAGRVGLSREQADALFSEEELLRAFDEDAYAWLEREVVLRAAGVDYWWPWSEMWAQEGS